MDRSYFHKLSNSSSKYSVTIFNIILTLPYRMLNESKDILRNFSNFSISFLLINLFMRNLLELSPLHFFQIIVQKLYATAQVAVAAGDPLSKWLNADLKVFLFS